MRSLNLTRPAVAFAALLLIAFLSGCTTNKKTVAKQYTFFPSPPDEPHIQFLTAFSSDTELGRANTFSDFITGRPTGPNPLVKPYGLAIKNGQIHVCDTMQATVEIFDLTKKRARYFTPRGEGRLQMPINIAIDDDGTRYIADTDREQVLIFAKDDTYKGAIGTKNEMKPVDVAILGDRLYIADLKNHCVRVYNKADRKLLFTVPRDEKDGPGKMYSPTNLALDKQGKLIVSDLGGFTVRVYDLEGKFERTIGQQGVAPGLFARPKGVAADPEGHIYVVDAATQVVQLFDPQGRLLMFFGQPGSSSEGELYLPAGVKVDSDSIKYFQQYISPDFNVQYLIFVTSQFGPFKVNVYGFGTKKQA